MIMDLSNDIIEIIHDSDNIVDIRKNLLKILSDIKDYQHKIKEYLNVNCVEFYKNLTNNELFIEKGDTLINETHSLLEIINSDVTQTSLSSSSCNDDLNQYINDINELQVGLQLSHKLMKINELFQQLNIAKCSNGHIRIIELLTNINDVITNQVDINLFQQLECYDNIKIKYRLESELMLYNLHKQFDTLVNFSEKVYQNTKLVKLRIAKDEDQLHDIIICLVNTKYNPKKLCDFLLNNVFKPIIMKPVSCTINETNPDAMELELSYSLKETNNSDDSDNLRPNYKQVFANLEKTICCLGYMNISVSDTECIFSLFGDYLKENFFSLIITECLNYSIPGTMNEMNDSTLVEDIIEFNQFLNGMLFINDLHDKQLLNYVERVDMLFKNRFCANIVDNAIEIMHKDLHDMILVTNDEFTTNTGTVVTTPRKSSNGDSSINFPSCMISKSSKDLTNLLDKVKKEASTATDKDIAERLQVSITKIIDRYIVEMPRFHAKLLINIPQQTGLFYNNCMYLAYWLNKFLNNDDDKESIDLLNSIDSLKRQGNDQFQMQIKNQQQQLMEILKNFDLSDAITELDRNLHKIIKQCLRQLDLLKNVWQTILPFNLYNKTMGSLLNDFLSEIMRRILFLEDIPTSISNELIQIFDVILERGPQIFEDPLQISVYVKLWTKLQQLKMILGASLVEITEQWASGKGPLTLNFKPDELKHLIRALFQNTDRRAKALVSIY